MYHPEFFCLDVTGNILITDTNRRDVKILSPSGHLIHEIGKKGQGREEFDSIQLVSVCQNQELYSLYLGIGTLLLRSF